MGAADGTGGKRGVVAGEAARTPVSGMGKAARSLGALCVFEAPLPLPLPLPEALEPGENAGASVAAPPSAPRLDEAFVDSEPDCLA